MPRQRVGLQAYRARLPAPDGAPDGWYRGRATVRSGVRHHQHTTLPRRTSRVARRTRCVRRQRCGRRGRQSSPNAQDSPVMIVRDGSSAFRFTPGGVAPPTLSVRSRWRWWADEWRCLPMRRPRVIGMAPPPRPAVRRALGDPPLVEWSDADNRVQRSRQEINGACERIQVSAEARRRPGRQRGRAPPVAEETLRPDAAVRRLRGVRAPDEVRRNAATCRRPSPRWRGPERRVRPSFRGSRTGPGWGA
ncbi:hypothetical protein EV578_101109 [Streptomyces sp. BK205]|nr:hypothetical protein EV578_101109 [Streptomyces sp. BK205]